MLDVDDPDAAAPEHRCLLLGDLQSRRQRVVDRQRRHVVGLGRGSAVSVVEAHHLGVEELAQLVVRVDHLAANDVVEADVDQDLQHVLGAHFGVTALASEVGRVVDDGSGTERHLLRDGHWSSSFAVLDFSFQGHYKRLVFIRIILLRYVYCPP